MKVTLEEITPNAEARMGRIARVSNPANQDNPDVTRLLVYCITHQHWSVFEHAHMTLEIETSLAIAAQILRHRSFTFQQFSQRYSDASQLGFEPIEFRQQAEKNRQGSTTPLEGGAAFKANMLISELLAEAEYTYRELLHLGVARECARMVLPQATSTRLYMTGNIRSWIHYLQLRTQPDTQLEHRQVAEAAQAIFVTQLPVISEALGWVEAKVTA
jgi:thymidylate synthase (FAD)